MTFINTLCAAYNVALGPVAKSGPTAQRRFSAMGSLMISSLALLLAIGCQLQMYEADPVSNTGSDTELPGTDEIWVKLTVNCDLDVCADGNDLKFYAFVGDEDLKNKDPAYWMSFGPVDEFPFNRLLKNGKTMMGVTVPWQANSLTGGVYYDLDAEDNKVAAEIDPKSTGNEWKFKMGEINDVVLNLEDDPSEDDVWIDLTIECDEADCSLPGGLFHFALYDGDEQAGMPDYYAAFQPITYPFHKIIRRMTNPSTESPKDLPNANVTGGGYHDVFYDALGSGLPDTLVDPADLYNNYTLKKGVLNPMKLQLTLPPKEKDVWLKLTVRCTDVKCQQSKKLRFYAFDGDEESIAPDYFNTFQDVTFPFHRMIKMSASHGDPNTPKSLPVGRITGGAYYDLDPTGMIFDPQDPQNSDNTIDLEAGIVNELDITLSIP